jgi:predicted lipid carrier protein YhbT
MDVEMAGQIDPAADAVLASDAIDEFFHNLQKVTNASATTSLRGRGEKLVFRAVDSDAAWSITLRDGGFDLVPASGDGDVVLEGTSLDLLLVIVRRRPIEDGPIDVVGEAALAHFWLENSAFD